MPGVSSLRPLEPGDAERLAELVRTNRDFLAPWEPARPDSYFTVVGQQEAVADSLRREQEGSMAPFVIVAADGSVVGRINLSNIVRGPFQSASVGYWLAEAAGGRGLASAAVGELARLAFGELGLHRLEAGTMPHNHRSQRVLLRNGFVRFGYAPRYLAIAGSTLR